jgi:hypothetical protein
MRRAAVNAPGEGAAVGLRRSGCDEALFERRLGRRSLALGEASEGAVEAPSDQLRDR